MFKQLYNCENVFNDKITKNDFKNIIFLYKLSFTEIQLNYIFRAFKESQFSRYMKISLF